ncbi:hypothetical protein [Pedobacter mucosus]|uniref:hypothetical protein n=1 Tax=Pedobacter mucosus TaxID=2895286 RepID=UPI001EE48D10|nr:hypothetical protein [Pedobacter mucosus]UKT65099.1 hypothetical protein LOK61_04805 [Pedobacter mucosus]
MNIRKTSPVKSVNGKASIIWIAIILLSATYTYGQQKNIKITGIKVSTTNINFDTSDSLLKYLNIENGTAAPRDLKKEVQTFSMTDDYANINFKWKNPLKYSYTWKDELVDDEQEAAMKEFLKLTMPLFNLSSDNTAGGNNSLGLAAVKSAAGVSPVIVNANFKDYDLIVLYTLLVSYQDKFTKEEREALNRFTVKLQALESTDTESYKTDAKKTFLELFNVNDPLQISKAGKDGVADIAETNLAGWNTSLEQNSKAYELAKDEFGKVSFTDANSNALFQAGIAKYLTKSKDMNASSKSAIAKLPPFIEKLKKSVDGDYSLFSFAQHNSMSRVRTIELEEGKKIETVLTIDKFKVASDGISIEKDKSTTYKKLIFRRYDPTTFSVSAGIFYGSTSLVGFGTSTANGETVVTQDTINRNTVVPALFGNFTLGVKSRYIAPTFQIGIDPTKRRPFLLLGGGLAFPVANMAITAGGIWTFEPTLNKLKAGDKITSTTELEKDIKNNFKIDPKGWYIGLQYNF